MFSSQFQNIPYNSFFIKTCGSFSPRSIFALLSFLQHHWIGDPLAPHFRMLVKNSLLSRPSIRVKFQNNFMVIFRQLFSQLSLIPPSYFLSELKEVFFCKLDSPLLEEGPIFDQLITSLVLLTSELLSIKNKIFKWRRCARSFPCSGFLGPLSCKLLWSHLQKTHIQTEISIKIIFS